MSKVERKMLDLPDASFYNVPSGSISGYLRRNREWITPEAAIGSSSSNPDTSTIVSKLSSLTLSHTIPNDTGGGSKVTYVPYSSTILCSKCNGGNDPNIPGSCYITEDGGATWNDYSSIATYNPPVTLPCCVDLKFFGSVMRFYMVGTDGFLYHRISNDDAWTRVTNASNAVIPNIKSVDFGIFVSNNYTSVYSWLILHKIPTISAPNSETCRYKYDNLSTLSTSLEGSMISLGNIYDCTAYDPTNKRTIIGSKTVNKVIVLHRQYGAFSATTIPTITTQHPVHHIAYSESTGMFYTLNGANILGVTKDGYRWQYQTFTNINNKIVVLDEIKRIILYNDTNIYLSESNDFLGTNWNLLLTASNGLTITDVCWCGYMGKLCVCYSDGSIMLSEGVF